MKKGGIIKLDYKMSPVYYPFFWLLVLCKCSFIGGMILLQQEVSSMFKSLIICQKKISVAFFRNFIEIVQTMQRKVSRKKKQQVGRGSKKILIRTLLNDS